MPTNDKNCKIYLSTTRTWVVVSRKYHREFNRPCDTLRHNRMYHKQCSCPRYDEWRCEGDCICCKCFCDKKQLSLDDTHPETGDPYSDFIMDENQNVEEIVDNRVLLGIITAKFRELDKDADRIIALMIANDGISDREIARILGRKQRTFASQMQRYRNEFKKIRDF